MNVTSEIVILIALVAILAAAVGLVAITGGGDLVREIGLGSAVAALAGAIAGVARPR